MMTCDDAAPLIARRADGDAVVGPAGARVDEHLAACAACRLRLADQRAVSSILRSRPADAVSPAFPARLAARLDRESGWLGLADWRAWTFRLAPVAAALALVAVLLTEPTGAAPLSLEEWAVSNAESSSAATLLWDDAVTSESVVETMVTGAAGAGGAGDVR